MKKVKINKKLLGLNITLSAASGQWQWWIWTNEKCARGLWVPLISSNERVRSPQGGLGVQQILSNESITDPRWRLLSTNGTRGGSQSINSHAAKIEVITQKILEMNSRWDTGQAEGWMKEKEEAEENKCWMQNLWRRRTASSIILRLPFILEL